MILQALLDQRYQRMGFNVRRKRESLRIREPRALQRHGGIAMTWVELEVKLGKVKGQCDQPDSWRYLERILVL